MAHPVLITQCLQRDFVEPPAAHAPLPNALHVGRAEALRLLGADPATGPVAQLAAWAREQPLDALDVLHVRDWHDPADPAQRTHLEQFGPHCLRGTPGASLVLDLDALRPNEAYVDAVGLNDFQGTDLAARLDAIRARVGQPLRVGVVGVWTEAKVTFLLYELATRCGIGELATCSALTASASRAQHFNALEQLRRILGVRVLDGVGDFVAWLRPEADGIRLPPVRGGARPALAWKGAPGTVAETDEQILAHLYRDSAKLELAPLGGGFSGATVLRVRGWDALGHEQAPSVAKLGPRATVAAERVAFERVEDILGNHAPSVRGFADLGERAGIKYAFAAMGAGSVRTFKSLYASGCEQRVVDEVLAQVFDEVLGRFHSAAHFEPLPLLDYYGFASRFAPGVRARVAELTGQDGETLAFPGGYELEHVARFYEGLDALPRFPGESHFVSYVHGDLNGANILLDGRDNVWLIDFFHAHRGHVLKDVAKLENDLLYIFTPVEDEATLEEALRVTRALRQVADLREPLGDVPEGVTRPPLLRAWETLRTLRGIGARLCRTDRNPTQLSVALLRYAVHTLSFDESNTWQKRWALAAACGHAEDVTQSVRETLELRVDWVRAGTPGRLGLTICPGRRDRGRVLADDLAALKAAGTELLVCMVPDDELRWAGAEALPDAAEAAGLRFVHAPVLDQGVPTPEHAAALVADVDAALRAGDDVVVHCMGGLGRSGTLAACVLVAHGLAPDAAIAAVRRARGPRAVESARQEHFVHAFAAARAN
jgi:protein-tyrosine phosphatase/nicotinamidase-related amidase